MVIPGAGIVTEGLADVTGRDAAPGTNWEASIPGTDRPVEGGDGGVSVSSTGGCGLAAAVFAAESIRGESMRREPDPEAVFAAAVSERAPVAPDGTRSVPDSGGCAPDGCSEPLAADSGGNDTV
jgi:hypothetical protein